MVNRFQKLPVHIYPSDFTRFTRLNRESFSHVIFCISLVLFSSRELWKIQWEVPCIGVSSYASHSVSGTQPAQVNSVPRAPASLPAVLEAHSGLKPVSPLTHLSLALSSGLGYAVHCGCHLGIDPVHHGEWDRKGVDEDGNWNSGCPK